MHSLLQFINFRAIFKRLRTYNYRSSKRSTYIIGRLICINCLTSSNRINTNFLFLAVIHLVKHKHCYSHLRNTRRHRESCPSFSIWGGYEINLSTWNWLINLTQYCIDCHYLSTSIHRIILLGNSIGVGTGTLTSIVFVRFFPPIYPKKQPHKNDIRKNRYTSMLFTSAIQSIILPRLGTLNDHYHYN